MTEIVVTRYNGGRIITAMGLFHILQRSHNMILIVMQAGYKNIQSVTQFRYRQLLFHLRDKSSVHLKLSRW